MIDMVDVGIKLFKPIFSYILYWMDAIYDRIGATEIVIAAITIALVASLIIRPLRGSRFSTSVFQDFQVSPVNRAKSSETGLSVVKANKGVRKR